MKAPTPAPRRFLEYEVSDYLERISSGEFPSPAGRHVYWDSRSAPFRETETVHVSGYGQRRGSESTSTNTMSIRDMLTVWKGWIDCLYMSRNRRVIQVRSSHRGAGRYTFVHPSRWSGMLVRGHIAMADVSHPSPADKRGTYRVHRTQRGFTSYSLLAREICGLWRGQRPIRRLLVSFILGGGGQGRSGGESRVHHEQGARSAERPD